MTANNKTFKYDTHVHTAETSPCGRVSAAELVRLYKQAGYDGIVITDHYFSGFFYRHLFKSWMKKADAFLAGYRAAAEEGKRLGMDVLLGMEISFDESHNDYLVYGIDEKFIRENRALYRLGLKKFKKLAEKNGLFVIQAHPYRPDIAPADPMLLDGVEVYNGNPRHDSSNHLALDFARENGLKMTSGSDFHQVMDLAKGGITVSERIRTSAALVRVIRDNGIIELIKD